MIEEIKRTVFEAKPVFASVIRDRGDESVLDYFSSHKYYSNSTDQYRKREFLDEVYNFCFGLFGEVVAKSVVRDLEKSYVVSTAPHHDPATHSFFVTSILATAISAKKDKRENVIVFSCAGVSLNNSSEPRRLLLHDSLGSVRRLNIVSRANHHLPVYARSPFARDDIERLITQVEELPISKKQKHSFLEVIKKSYLSDDILKKKSYSDQISVGVFNLWKNVPGMEDINVVYIPQEALAANFIIKFHLYGDTIINKIILNEDIRAKFLSSFDGITGSYSSDSGKGTELFWGISDNKRISLRVIDGRLVSPDGALSIAIDADSIRLAIEEKRVIPSMALSFSILSFYYGVVCAGGFSQVGYLGEMKRAYIGLLNSLGGYESEIKYISGLPTDFLAGDISTVFIDGPSGVFPATTVDLLIYRDKYARSKIMKSISNTKLNEAVEYMLPDLFRIITGRESDIHPKTKIPSVIKIYDCFFCGNYPANHAILKIDSYVSRILSPFERLSNSRFGFYIGGIINRFLTPVFLKAMTYAGIVNYSDDISDISNARSRVIWEEAKRRKIKIRQIKIFGKPTDFYEAELNGKKGLFESIPIKPALANRATIWMDDKFILKKKLLENGLPAPRGGAFNSFYKMRLEFERLDKPVIVKPASGSRGRHTTTFINNEKDLLEAYKIGKEISRLLVMEEHLIGSVYRGTVVDGKLVGVLRGDPPRVMGDGKHTISELIKIKNDSKHPKVADVLITPYLQTFISRNNLSLNSILPAGKTIDLIEKIGIPYGGYSVEVTDIVHDDIRKVIEEAGRVINYPVIGFDFIIQDISKSPYGQKWGIIEANSLPFINLHHYPMEGKPVNVAKYVWDLWSR